MRIISFGSFLKVVVTEVKIGSVVTTSAPFLRAGGSSFICPYSRTRTINTGKLVSKVT